MLELLHEVKLGDGNVWFAPVARRAFMTRFPRRYSKLTPTADIRAEVLSEYVAADSIAQALDWERASDDACWAEAWAHFSGAVFDSQTKIDSCVVLLQALYRIGYAEAAVLRLWDDDALNAILEAAIDEPGRQAMSKKERGVLSAWRTEWACTLPGDPEDSPTTDQQSQISV